MRMVFGLVLVVGLALAGFAVYMAQGYINQSQLALARERAAQAKMIPTVPVFVAAKDLPYGAVIKKEDVISIGWPQNAVPASAVTDIKAMFPEGDNKQRIVLRPIAKFEPLLASNMTGPGEDPGITNRLSKGMRAFAIKVDVASGVSGFLRPGDKVDVYWTGQSPADKSAVTRLIQAAVDIIAVDQSADANSPGAIIARTVTVSVSPQDVATLAQAQATGKLSLSLVGSQDTSVASAEEVDSNRLLGITEAAAPKEVEKPKVCTIKQRTGATVTEVPIPCTN